MNDRQENQEPDKCICECHFGMPMRFSFFVDCCKRPFKLRKGVEACPQCKDHSRSPVPLAEHSCCRAMQAAGVPIDPFWVRLVDIDIKRKKASAHED